MPGIVLDAGTIADFLEHLDVVLGPLLDPLRFKDFVFAFEVFDPLFQFGPDAPDCFLHLVLPDRKQRRRKDVDDLFLIQRPSGHGVVFLDALDLVVKELDAVGPFLGVRRDDVQILALDPERSPFVFDVVMLELHPDEPFQKFAAIDDVADAQGEDLFPEVLRITQPVNARHARDDDHVVALHERAYGAMTHLVDVVVDVGGLLDVQVPFRNVGFRLIVVVIGDKIFDAVFRKKGLEFAEKLSRQRLVMGQDQRLLPDRLDDVGDGEGLAGAGGPEQYLLPDPVLQILA